MITQEYLKLMDEVNENGKYKADWASLLALHCLKKREAFLLSLCALML